MNRPRKTRNTPCQSWPGLVSSIPTLASLGPKKCLNHPENVALLFTAPDPKLQTVSRASVLFRIFMFNVGTVPTEATSFILLGLLFLKCSSSCLCLSSSRSQKCSLLHSKSSFRFKATSFDSRAAQPEHCTLDVGP